MTGKHTHSSTKHDSTVAELQNQIQILCHNTHLADKESQLKLATAYKSLAEIHFRQSNYEESKSLYAKALHVFNRIDNYNGYLACHNACASICLAKGDLPAAKNELKNLLQLLKEKPHDDYEHIVLNNLGIVYDKTGDLARAVLYFYRSLALKKELSSSISPTYTLHNLASIYYQVEDYETALNYNRLALKSIHNTDDLVAKASIYNGIAQSLLRKKQNSEAQKYFTEAKEFANTVNSLTHLAEALTGLGHLAFRKGDFNLAMELLEESLATSKNIEEQENIVRCLIDLAKINQNINIELALQQANEAITICQKNGYRALLATVYQLTGKLKAKQNDYVNAYYYSQLYTELFRETNKTSILNQVEVSRLSLELKNSQLQSKQFQNVVEKLEHDSSHDHLTGAGNRRHLDRVLSENWSSNSKDTKSNHLAMLDIDDFKKVNDNFSHAMGDEILQQTARIIQEHLGKNDLLFRYGGEEFVILIKGKGKKEACDDYENIRQSIQNYKWQNFHKDLFVTATLGMVSNTEYQRIKRALQVADERMYHGKNMGKNRLIDKV